MPVFDIVLPTYNNLDELKECIRHLEKQTFDDFQVYFCVDGSTDNTMEYIEKGKFKFDYKVLTHPNYENKGRNPTRNLVLPYLESRYLCMIDTDIRPAEDFLKNHYELLEDKNCLSLGNVIYTNTAENIWADYLQTRGKNKFKDFEEIPTYYLNSQNLAMRSEDFISIGGQDEKMTTYGGGDTEFGYRISKQLRTPMIFNKKAVGYSEMPKSIDFALNQMIEFGKINLPYIHNKYPEFQSLFKFDIIESSSLKSLLVKSLLKEWIYNSIYSLLPLTPASLRRKLIHYLVFYKINEGYKIYLKEKSEIH